jgi:threonine/homoserine/homoserine lactone efflux protein
MSFLQILPLAFVMIAGPQIITSFFLATGQRFGANSGAYIAGAAISVTALTTAAYLIGRGAKSAGGHSTNKVLDWIVLALLLVLIVHTFLTRNKAGTPKWMKDLEHEQPRPAFNLGLLLFSTFPGDILTSVTVGFYIARHGQSWWHILPFVILTLLILALPALGVVLLGHRARVVLPKIRDWMNQNSWIVSEVVLVFFVVIIANSLAS